jgi:hypothetical protein
MRAVAAESYATGQRYQMMTTLEIDLLYRRKILRLYDCVWI